MCVCVCAGLGVCGSTMQSSACAPEVFLADGKQRGACNTGQQQLHVCIIHQLRISQGRNCSPQVIEGSKGEHSIAYHSVQLVADLSGPCAHTALRYIALDRPHPPDIAPGVKLSTCTHEALLHLLACWIQKL